MNTRYGPKKIFQDFRSHIKWFVAIFVLIVIAGMVYNFYISKAEPEIKYNKTLIVYLDNNNGDSYYVANSINNLLYEQIFTDNMKEYCLREAEKLNININEDDFNSLSSHSVAASSNYLKIIATSDSPQLSTIINDSYKNVIDNEISELTTGVEFKYIDEEIVENKIEKGHSIDKALEIYCIIALGIVCVAAICYSFYDTMIGRNNGNKSNKA